MNQLHIIAPGEGKIPENVLFSEHWDALAFPILHPDGKNNLHQERSVKLTDQMYFIQRLLNIDARSRSNSSYVFAAEYYLSRKTLQSNVNLSYMRGKKHTTSTGAAFYSLEDAFSVFDSLSNTPSYHKKGKYEMMAILDNLGGFQICFTLSCADTRWIENATSFLMEHNVTIVY